MSDRFGTRDLLTCYRRGVFPMADSRDDPNLFLIDPDERGIFLLDDFHVPRRLKKTIRQEPFRISFDEAFSRVIEGCGEEAPGRETTWINPAIFNLYSALHREGHAHSVEAWQGETLVGGAYGVHVEGAFFGESMFSRATDASKICLVHLVAKLIQCDFSLLDAQFYNPHLEQFGLRTIARDDFKTRLALAMDARTTFDTNPLVSGEAALQLIEDARAA